MGAEGTPIAEGAVDPPRFDDPFARLGLRPCGDLSREAIDGARRVLLSQLHPDRQVDDVARAQVLRDAAQVNLAAQVLIHPERRVEALLSLIDPRGSAVSPHPSQLMELLERRECVQSADYDPAQCRGTLAWIADERALHRSKVQSQIELSSPDFSLTRRALAYLKALARLEEAIEDWQRAHEEKS